MRPKPKASPMDKKIVPNPRYKNIETSLDTGNNLRKELERLEEVHQFYKFRNDEVFRRVNINNLVRLLIEQTKLEYQLNPSHENRNIEDDLASDLRSEFNDSAHDELEFDINDGAENGENKDEDIRSLIASQFDGQVVTARHQGHRGVRSVTSVIQGIGENDQEEHRGQDDRRVVRPFVILDVRDPEEYSRGHLVYSHSYQHTRLNRAFDYETKEMLRVKNKAGMILVVTDDDESLSRQVATTLTQRGYDNVFMLSGGLRVASLKYPDTGLVVTEDVERLEEGDLMILDTCLEDNILTGGESVRSGRSRQRGQGVRASSLRLSGDFRTSTPHGERK